jgi:hypothetical protein
VGGRGPGLVLVISDVVVIVQHTPPPPPPFPQRHFQSMIVLGSGVLPLPQAMIGNVLGRNPNCKIFIKILEILCILTKPKKFKIN